MQKPRQRPRLRFIPFRKKDVVEMCLATGALSGKDQMRFRDLTRVLQSVFHFEHHDLLETLKDLYAPINPDRDTRKVGVFTDSQDANFVDTLSELLNRANYEKLTDQELALAFEESSLFKLKLDINFDDFEEVLLFTRGESQHREKVKAFFGLVSNDISFTNFDRVVIYIRFAEHAAPAQAKGKPGATMLKMFQNVPKADVEMLFPNTRVGMRTIDKLLIGVPALIGAGAIFTTQAGASLILLGTLLGFYLGLHSEVVELDEARLIAVLAALGGLGGYIWRQIGNFRNRKLMFMQTLTQSLYFKNLDNNAGVFHRLVDDAEEEECKEAILGYYFLLTGGRAASAEELDQRVESFFRDRWDSEVDFEVDDALAKLKHLGLVQESDAGLEVVEVEEACRLLDARWDEYFNYNTVAGMRDA